MPRLSSLNSRSLTGIGLLTPPITPPAIGDFWSSQGGYYGGQISTTGNGVATHYLVISPKATGDVTGYTTTQPQTTTSVSDSLRIDGPGNTNYLYSQGSAAATWVKGLTINGFTDWYLPARDELLTIYYNLKPGTTANVSQLTQGSLYFGVPKRTQYTSTTNPGQTAVTLFRTGGAQAFEENLYNRSDTETGGFITPMVFSNGQTSGGYNLSAASVFRWRAIRRVPV